MKKSILLLCVAFVLLFAGCDKTPEAATDETSSAEPYVLQVAPEDRNQAIIYENFVETPEGYYYGWEKLIYFCPRGGDKFYPLCGKPNCKHDSPDCNAWFHGDLFGYYNGSLYAVNRNLEFSKLAVEKMNLDGTDHQVVAEVDISEIASLSYSFSFHHGKLFIYTGSVFLPQMADKQDRMIVMDLADYSISEPFTDYLQTEKFPDMVLRYYKDKLYGYTTGSLGPLVEMNTATGEVRNPLPVDSRLTNVYATDTTLYSFEPDPSLFDPSLYGDEAGSLIPGFHEYDLKTGETKDCGLPVADLTWARYDNELICAGTNKVPMTVYFFSRDYELLGQIQMEERQHVYGMTSDRIYFSGTQIESPISFYLEKSKIREGDFTLIPIETQK